MYEEDGGTITKLRELYQNFHKSLHKLFKKFSGLSVVMARTLNGANYGKIF